MNKSRVKLSNFDQRVAWLVAHKADWYDDYFYNTRLMKWIFDSKNTLIKLMKLDGLIAKSTYPADCKLANELHAAANIIRSNK